MDLPEADGPMTPSDSPAPISKAMRWSIGLVSPGGWKYRFYTDRFPTGAGSSIFSGRAPAASSTSSIAL